MEFASSVSFEATSDDLQEPPALLRGTARGLEMLVQGRASTDAVVAALAARLDEAPGFFRGSDVRIGVEGGPLAPGCLGRIDELCARFDLRIVEVGAAKAKEPDAVPVANLALGSAPAPAGTDAPVGVPDADMSAVLAALDTSVPSMPAPEPAPEPAPAPELETEPELAATHPRLVLGPIRSGIVLEHIGHVFVFGDVNPGAEVRATGSIVVLGRMRGTAHAGIGGQGFILALKLEPQQLRIGRMVARAGDDAQPTDPEIAYVNQDRIVVECYRGNMPRNLASSL